jgi:aminoglycoside phosphotransferase family enzyme/predicted kinase
MWMKTVAANRLIQAMQKPTFYDHSVEQVELIETHISWVFLAGDFAYKVKKPVAFGFLDFSTLAKRHHYCLEEVRLNRRFAPQLYLDVKKIGGDPACIEMDGSPALDYAIRMRRFEQKDQLDRVLADGRLSVQMLVRFASMIASFHRTSPVAEAEQSYGAPQSIIGPALENFSQIRPLLPALELRQLTVLEKWSCKSCDDLYAFMRQRKTNGFIRECHGDVHLANMAWIDDEPILFDCIEFNDNLRWIDVINDIAFLVMDLDDRGQTKLGWHFLNRYLQESGDYEGLRLLRFYKVYRAMVRAKVTCMRLAQAGLSDAERKYDLSLYHSYLDLASSYTAKPSKRLIITHGLSGSGKSTFVRELAASCGAIHLQSDRERKRLYGHAATADSHSPPGGGIYSAQANAATYERLEQLASIALAAGYPVIVDATFLKTTQRDLLRRLAADLHLPLIIIDFIAPEAELRRRIQQRAIEGVDSSDANAGVLNYQLTEQQPLDENEQRQAITVCPETTLAEVAASLSALVNGE